MTGTTTRVSKVEVSRPPITVTAIGVRISEPSPRPRAIGSKAQNGGQRGHHDRPQSQAGCLPDRAEAVEPSRPQLVDQVDQHNGVVDHDASQHDQPDEHDHAEARVGEPQRQRHADGGQRESKTGSRRGAATIRTARP